jgi:uncharacterized protein YecT (DUF1311 family)
MTPEERMKNTAIGQCATVLFCVAFHGSVAAQCGSVDNASSACRYPTGDAWCARHGGGNLYAYKDGCVEANNTADTNLATRPPAPAKSWSPVVEWDCAKAKTVVEHLICVNPDVRAQDARMGALYAAVQARGRLPERMQKAWLIDQRNACDNADCLRAVYAERIRSLETLAAMAPETTVAPIAGAPGAALKTARPPPPSAAETATTEASAPVPEPTPTTLMPTSQTGIPMLPLPEAPTLDLTGAAAVGASAGTQPPSSRASLKSGTIALMGAAALLLGFALFAWRDCWRIGASSRRRLAVFAQRMRTAAGLRLGGWRRPRMPARAGTSAGAPAAVPAMALAPGLLLSDDIIARLHALARPGEPLSSVVARAVAALEVTPEPPPPDAVLLRLAALETRLAQVEGAGSAEGVTG